MNAARSRRFLYSRANLYSRVTRAFGRYILPRPPPPPLPLAPATVVHYSLARYIRSGRKRDLWRFRAGGGTAA